VADFLLKHTNPNPTQHDPHGADDPFRTISNCHHLDMSGHDGMDEQDVGWRKGWCCEDFGLRSWANVADFLFKPKPMNPNPTHHNPHGPDDPFRRDP
jgi:hypothetical protein